ncbi:hypothetical protein ABPG72_004569 [Tetrahymena utriculariae]
MSNNNNYNNQIYSNLPDKSIFGSSLSGQQFKDLFNHLENGNSKITKNKMQKIVDMAKQLHKDQEVEDAYICIYYFLNQIRKQLFDSEKEEFDQNFLLKFCDQLECKDCKQKIQNTQDQYTFQQYESFGQKCISFSQTFSSQGDKGLFQEVNPDLICDICKSNNFSTRREYQVAPNFMMIRLLKFDKQPNNNYENNFLEQQFKLPVQGQQFPEKYQIIGFCGFQFYRYKYFAKYDSEWLEFNDHFTYSLFSPNYSNATYFILKKIYCNAEVTQERQFNEKSSKQINMNILKKYNNQYQQMGYQQCSECQIGYTNYKRLYLETPNYLIINQNSQELNKCLSEKINNIFKIQLDSNHIQRYQIIGFCSFSNQEYSYIAKCKDN